MKKFLLLIALVAVMFTGCIKQGNQKLWDEAYINRVQIGDTLIKAIELYGNFRSSVKQKKGKTETRTYSWIFINGTKGGSVNLTVNSKGIITYISTTKTK